MKLISCSSPLQSQGMIWVAHGWVLFVPLVVLYCQTPFYVMYGPLGMALNYHLIKTYPKKERNIAGTILSSFFIFLCIVGVNKVFDPVQVEKIKHVM